MAPSASPDRTDLLFQTRAELAACWRRGEGLRAETCLARTAALDGDAAALLDLVQLEILLRLDRKDTPQLEDYLARLPGHEADLRHLFALLFPGTLVPLKMILDPDTGHNKERFLAEAKAIALLRHPSIVQIYEVDVAEGKPYFALEYCPGGNLGAFLAGTPQPPRLCQPCWPRPLCHGCVSRVSPPCCATAVSAVLASAVVPRLCQPC